MAEEFSEDRTAVDEYIGILAVDVRRFSAHDDDKQKTIVNLLPEILQQAAARAGIDHWRARARFKGFRGDGYLIGLPRELLSGLVDRYFDALQVELRQRLPQFRALDVEIRLRAALDLGPVRSFDEQIADSPSGKVMVNAARMLDATAVRDLLDRSDPAVTFVAVALSDSVMEDVVAAGHTVRQRSEFVAAPILVSGKEYKRTGYLRVPAPSGELLRSGMLIEKIEHEAEAAAAQVAQPATDTSTTPLGVSSNETGGDSESVVQARDVNGDIRDSSVREASSGVTVTGDHNVTAGRDQSLHHQEFSGRFLTGGDSNFGPASGRRVGRHDTQSEG